MTKPTLFLFVGYPGAGKTTAARVISAATGGTHLWADNVRWDIFKQPQHSLAESTELYDLLNKRTAELLREGQCVIFDTNFNHRADRDTLRKIAAENGARTVLIWLTTPLDLAHERAVHSDTTRNGYTVNMTHDTFEQIVQKLEEPSAEEYPLKFDGTDLDIEKLKAAVRQE